MGTEREPEFPLRHICQVRLIFRFIFGWKAESIIALIQYYTASWVGLGSGVRVSASNSE